MQPLIYQSERIPTPQDPSEMFKYGFSQAAYAVWLDSSQADPIHGRYSLMGAASAVIESDGERCHYHAIIPSELDDYITPSIPATQLLDVLKKIMTHWQLSESNTPSSDAFKGGFIGYLNYEFSRYLDFKPSENNAPYANACWMWIDTFIQVDHMDGSWHVAAIGTTQEAVSKKIKRLTQVLEKKKFERRDTPFIPTITSYRNVLTSDRFQLHRNESDYAQAIAKAKNYITEGDSYEICLSNEFRVPFSSDAFLLYKRLRDHNSAPYSAWIHTPSVCILSASPECFFRLDSSGKILSEPIKGTRPLGRSESETQSAIQDLQSSEKDASELLMITDLIRNDLGKICEWGSIQVPHLKKIKAYATVLQMMSEITGQLRTGLDGTDALQALFPGGSVTGAPKYRTVEIIQELENRPRGIFTGAIGFLSVNQSAVFNIAIRTMAYEKSAQKIRIGCGGAIVTESQADTEFEEILVKAYGLLRVFN